MTPMLAIAALMAVATERPTGNGDRIGTAEMHRDGRIVMRLRSVECDGTVVEGLTETRPTDPHYAETIAWLRGIRPGQRKPAIARDLAPCRRR